jgi:hypothetical protein
MLGEGVWEPGLVGGQAEGDEGANEDDFRGRCVAGGEGVDENDAEYGEGCGEKG